MKQQNAMVQDGISHRRGSCRRWKKWTAVVFFYAFLFGYIHIHTVLNGEIQLSTQTQLGNTPTTTAAVGSKNNIPNLEPSTSSSPQHAQCVGIHELKGRRTYMEDNHAIFPSPFASTSADLLSSMYLSTVARNSSFYEEFAHSFNTTSYYSSLFSTVSTSLYGVFDGHGGSSASSFAAVWLLPILYQGLVRFKATSTAIDSDIVKSYAYIDADASLPVNALSDERSSISSLLGFDSTSWPPTLNFDADIISGITPHPPFLTASSTPIPLLADLPRTELSNISSVFTEAFLYLDDAYKVHSSALHKQQARTDGTTALVVALDMIEKVVTIANAGDCRALVIRDCVSETNLHDNPTLLLDDHYEASFDDIEFEEQDIRTMQILASHSQKLTYQFPYYPLSVDHKPHLPAEYAYITSQPSGFVTKSSSRSVPRVMGVLATSRAIGDYELKPYIRAEPDIYSYRLHMVEDDSVRFQGNIDLNALDVSDLDPVSDAFPTLSILHQLKSAQCIEWSDRWLLLASDGFFEVFSNANVSATIRALSQSNNNMKWIAEQLTKKAYARGSTDNITVMLIDLYCTLGIV